MDKLSRQHRRPLGQDQEGDTTMNTTLDAPPLDAPAWLMALRIQMAASGRTNRHIARQLAISDPAMSRIMTGVTPLTPELRVRLLLALHRDTFDAAPEVVRAFAVAPTALSGID